MSRELLDQLRIDRSADRPPRRRGRLYAVVALALVLAATGAWFGWAGMGPTTVQLTGARAAAAGGGPGSVLDASGYVTARRQAPVSAQNTGKVTEGLIEEGKRGRGGGAGAERLGAAARQGNGVAQNPGKGHGGADRGGNAGGRGRGPRAP